MSQYAHIDDSANTGAMAAPITGYEPNPYTDDRGAPGGGAVYNVPSYEVEHQGADGWQKSYGLPYTEVGATGCNFESVKRVFTSPIGVIRLIEFFCSLLAFSIMSSQQSFDKQSAFGFLVFACVVTWIFVLFILPAHVTDCHSQFSWLFLVELSLDILFSVFTFAAAVAVAAKCQENAGTKEQPIKFCSDLPKVKAAAGFCFVLSFFLMASVFFSFKRFRNPPRGGNARL